VDVGAAQEVRVAVLGEEGDRILVRDDGAWGRCVVSPSPGPLSGEKTFFPPS
jgi:hypothetical protein